MNESLWNEWVEPFDVFISYARADNEPPRMVSAFVERLEADFADFSPALPLKVFFDKAAIKDMQDWQQRLQQGLRQSKVMIAFLSEAYFKSEWCRREWEEYIRAEQARTYPGEALAPIFIVAPADLEKLVPAAAREWWTNVTARNAVVEIHPYWNKGREALQEIVIGRRIDALKQNIRTRIEWGRVLAKVPRNVKGRNPNFVGRVAALSQLRDRLQAHERVGLCAVLGVGGIGKSTVVREYAYLFRKEYLGGQFEIDLSTLSTLEQIHSQITQLAKYKLNAPIPPNLPDAVQYAQAKAVFEAQPAPVLLILDNLNEDAAHLVGRVALDTLPNPEKVHLLVTTRAEPRTLGGLDTVTLETLSAADALDLMFRYKPYRYDPNDPQYLDARQPSDLLVDPGAPTPEQEWKAALRIANMIGRHTLAVTLVAAFLKVDRKIAYTKFLEQLETLGIGLALDKIGSVKAVQGLIQHPEAMIRQLFEKSLARLSKLALRILEYAAFLPADIIPLAWLEQLVKADADVAGELAETLGSPPWEEALTELDGLQYLVGQPYARMHRVVQEVLLRRMKEPDRLGRDQVVLTFVERNTDGSYSDLNEVAATEQFVRARADRPEQMVGQTAMWLVGPLQDLGHLGAAIEMATLAERILRAVLADDPHSAEKKRDLSISFDRLGDVSVASGDLQAARGYFEEGLKIRRQLAQDDPHSAEKKRDLSISFNNLGEVSVASGDLQAARGYFEEGLKIRRQLAQDDPHSAQKKRDLSISFNKLGEVSVASGDLQAARGYFEEGLKIRRQLAQDDPHSAQKKRDLSISFNKLGEVSVASGDLQAARGYFEEGLKIRRQLAQDDPHSAEKKRDLSISFDRLGEVSVASGDLQAARGYFEEGLKIRRQLAQDDPHSAQKKRDLSISFNKLGEVSVASGDLQAARGYFEEGLKIRRQLAQDDPHSAEKKRDLSISFHNLGEVSVASGDLQAARGYFEECLKISRQLAQDDPHSAQKKRDLSISFNNLGEVSVASGDLQAARGYFEEGLKIRRQLAQDDPHSAQKKRDLSISFHNLGEVSVASGDLQAARGYFEECLKISRQLAQDDPHSAEKKSDLSISFNNLGEVSVASGDLQAARGYFEEGLKISRQLAQDDPHSAQKKRDLFYSYYKMGDLLMKSERWHEALPVVEQGLTISEQLSAMDPTNATWQKDMRVSRRLVAELRAKLAE